MKTGITFENNRQVSIVSSVKEIIGEINHFQAYWLSADKKKYTNAKGSVIICTEGLSNYDQRIIAEKMR